MDKPFDKKYENKEWLAAELATKTSRQISKEIGVSYKLINIWAINHGLIRRTPETVVA
jgi:hypothetical protein